MAHLRRERVGGAAEAHEEQSAERVARDHGQRRRRELVRARVPEESHGHDLDHVDEKEVEC